MVVRCATPGALLGGEYSPEHWRMGTTVERKAGRGKKGREGGRKEEGKEEGREEERWRESRKVVTTDAFKEV